MQSDRNVRTQAAAANLRGLDLRARGRTAEAADAFREAIAAHSGLPELHVNLAETLVQLGRLDDARDAYLRTLALDEGNEHAHLALYEIEQVRGDRAAALRHQAHVLGRRSQFTIQAPNERRRVIVLLAPGDWQANVPIDYLVDYASTTLHKIYLTTAAQAGSMKLPDADAIFTAIAYSPENSARLNWAEAIVQRSGLPALNLPQHIRNTERERLSELLHGLDGAYVPRTQRHERGTVSSAAREFPIVIRPEDSQAGAGLARITGADELAGYLRGQSAGAFYVMPFVDYKSPDGFYRKYRIFIAGGAVLPCHLAISPHWMIHYYNAPMREHQWMRDEERSVLDDFERHFPTRVRDALAEIAQRVHLDYIGIDCAIDRDGRLLVFEADPAMIVHAADEPELFAYKHAAARRIFAAFEELIDRARSR